MDNRNNWKGILGYPGYLVNEVGEVKDPDGVVVVPFMRGKYPAICMKSKENKWIIHSLHILVCTVFHGERPLPEGKDKIVTVNHKDGNKLNPTKSNLEWISNSKNIIHAFKNRLNKSSVHITVSNVNTGEVIHLHSLRELARWTEIPNVSGRAVLTKFKDELYNGVWVIEEKEPAISSAGERTRSKVYVFDLAAFFGLRKGESEMTFTSSHEASAKLNLDRKSIKRAFLKGIGKITAGFVISKNPIEIRPTDYKLDDVKQSLWWANFYNVKKRF